MTLADDLKPLARSIRGIPGQFGIRPHTVALLERSWDGTYTGDGTRTDATVALTEGGGYPPKVRWLSDEDVAVGGLSNGTIEVGPITADGSGIEILANIRGDDLENGDARYLVVTGPKHPNGAKYRITRITADRAIHYTIQARPVSQDGG